MSAFSTKRTLEWEDTKHIKFVISLKKKDHTSRVDARFDSSKIFVANMNLAKNNASRIRFSMGMTDRLLLITLDSDL